MKVLFLTNIPSPYRIDFFNELSKYCDLTVLFERDGAEDRNEEWFKRDNINFNAVFLNGMKFRADSAINLGIFKFLNKTDFDIITVGGYSTPTGLLAILYMKYKRIPYILSADGGIIRKESKVKRWIKNYFIGSASAWLSTGEKTTEYLLHYGAEKEKISLYNFTSLNDKDIKTKPISEYEKDKLKTELNIKQRKVVITIGSFIHRKGFDILIKSCQNLDQNVGVYIIGGEATEEYTLLKEELKLKNVYFVGFKSKQELDKYYSVADLFVLPTREDIWGLVINEAMGYGLPVITTDMCVAGLELVQNSSNGFIVPINDEKELARKINLVIHDDVLRSTMQKASLCKIKEYTIQNMALQHIQIFNSLR